MPAVATRSNRSELPPSLLEELEQRKAGLARHMARAVVSLVRWDDSTGAPPRREAIAKACVAGLDLFLATAREARPATQRELREVAQLGILQARGSQSVEPVLAAYRIAARVAWEAILRAWRHHPEATPEAMVVTANYVFTALDQVAAEVTRTFLHAREQHMQRGTRARGRLFHSLISDTFDSEIALQKQALALNLAIATGYIAAVCKLVIGRSEGDRGGEALAELVSSFDLPPRALAHATDPSTLVLLWPAESTAAIDGATRFLDGLQAEAATRWPGARLRAGMGGYHPGLRGISRSYLEAQQALEMGRKLRTDGGLQHHDELIPYLVLTQNPVLAERYVSRHLGRLLAARSSNQLLDTLDAYLRRGSIKEAALTLHLHRHTVIYRLDKVKGLLGVDLEDPAARLGLQLALDLRRLL